MSTPADYFYLNVPAFNPSNSAFTKSQLDPNRHFWKGCYYFPTFPNFIIEKHLIFLSMYKLVVLLILFFFIYFLVIFFI